MQHSRILLCILASALLSGCARTSVTTSLEPYRGNMQNVGYIVVSSQEKDNALFVLTGTRHSTEQPKKLKDQKVEDKHTEPQKNTEDSEKPKEPVKNEKPDPNAFVYDEIEYEVDHGTFRPAPVGDTHPVEPPEPDVPMNDNDPAPDGGQTSPDQDNPANSEDAETSEVILPEEDNDEE